MGMYMCQHVNTVAHDSQKKTSDRAELELQVVVELPDVGPGTYTWVLCTAIDSLLTS